MFLRNLKLRNIRSIGELEISFANEQGDARQWTYLLGENGAGKSTLLKSIGLIMAGSDALIDLVGDPDSWIQLGQDEGMIEVEFSTKSDEPRTARLDFKRDWSISRFISNNEENLEQIDRAIEKADRNYFIVGYGVARHSNSKGHESALKSGRDLRTRALATLFDLDTALVSLETWAMDLDYRKGESGMDSVRKALNTLLPDVTFAEIDRENRSLKFDTVDGGLPFAALSDGYKSMASWCGDLLFQITETFEDYNDPLKARGLLLIDEIDLHLHPSWQRRLVSFIKETLPNVQVVATTHSPLTIHQAGEGELYVLRRDSRGPAYLTAYHGAPNTLMLHQLLQSPLFGLETLDSPQVQAAREELRELQGIGIEKAGPTPDESKRIEQLETMLEDVPSWTQTRPGLERTNDVLEKLSRHLVDKDKSEALIEDIDLDDFGSSTDDQSGQEGEV